VRLKVSASHDGIGKYAHWDGFAITRELLAPTPPLVYNLDVAQRADGSGLVDIFYDLYDPNGDTSEISVLLSQTTDGPFDYTPQNLSGDLGPGLANGTGKHIVWNAAAEGIAYDDNQFRVRIVAEDLSFLSELVLVEGGTFNNGTSNVAISSFYIDKYELTQSDYETVLGVNPAHNYGVGDIYPVYYVSWFAAIEYCNLRSIMEGFTPCYSYLTYGTNPSEWPSGWNTISTNHSNISCNWSANGYRLPTEMEWMYAARGGNLSQGYLYSGSNNLNEVGWYLSNSGSLIHTKGTKLPNEIGLFDMSGNVWEWCWDIYGTYPSGPRTNPTGATSGTQRLFRGGCFLSQINHCTTAFRYNIDPMFCDKDAGFRVCRSVDDFIMVEGGTFNNGTSNVTISSFYIDKLELTQAGYQAVMGVNPSYFTGVTNGPVEQVTWFNAIEYCNRRSMQEALTPCYSYLSYGTNPDYWPSSWNTSNANHTDISCNWTANGYRLPTEMEWMFAAKGGNQSQGYTYSGSNSLNTVGWYGSNSGGTTHTVGTKAPNELGTFDMSGNVREWCWDIYGDYPSGPQTDPHGATSGSYRVYRGGGFSYSAGSCTVSFRLYGEATYSNPNVGFRVCRRP
jgi:formylglycine-generating enzyme required for sulfatase activity